MYDQWQVEKRDVQPMPLPLGQPERRCQEPVQTANILTLHFQIETLNLSVIHQN